ncbi:MAG: hypothetical protein U9Q15_04105 [Patescibacteria group bacterium]|nr:hypothetical protein [Patescibacteria group bacterium]
MTTIHYQPNIGIDTITLKTPEEFKAFFEKYIATTSTKNETKYDEHGIEIGDSLTQEELKDIDEHNKISKNKLKDASIFINQYL